MPRTKGSKNRPKINNNFTSQIAEKQESITFLTAEITSITANINALKFPSSCTPTRKQNCVHSKVASGFVFPVSW